MPSADKLSPANVVIIQMTSQETEISPWFACIERVVGFLLAVALPSVSLPDESNSITSRQ